MYIIDKDRLVKYLQEQLNNDKKTITYLDSYGDIEDIMYLKGLISAHTDLIRIIESKALEVLNNRIKELEDG